MSEILHCENCNEELTIDEVCTDDYGFSGDLCRKCFENRMCNNVCKRPGDNCKNCFKLREYEENKKKSKNKKTKTQIILDLIEEKGTNDLNGIWRELRDHPAKFQYNEINVYLTRLVKRKKLVVISEDPKNYQLAFKDPEVLELKELIFFLMSFFQKNSEELMLKNPDFYQEFENRYKFNRINEIMQQYLDELEKSKKESEINE